MTTDLKTFLQDYTKQELSDIGNLLGISFPRIKTKAGMVSALDTYLRTRPSEWLSHLMERDLIQLEGLIETGPDKYQAVEYADYPSTLEVLGLVDVKEGDENADFKQICLPRVIYDITAPHIRKVRTKREKSGQLDFERVALGYLNLYGVLEFDQFVDLMFDYLEKLPGMDYGRMKDILSESPVLKLFRTWDEKGEGDYICSPCIDKIEYVLEDRKEFKMSEFKHFTPEQALEAGTGAPFFTPCLSTPEGIALENSLRRAGYSGYDLVKELYEVWICAQSDADFEDLFYAIENRVDQFPSESNYYEALRAVENFANSVPKWSLCGKSADETGCLRVSADIEDPYEDVSGEEIPIRWEMPSPTVSEGYPLPYGFPFGLAVPHVAKDDPCPCGSGLRYGQCHGKYLS